MLKRNLIANFIGSGWLAIIGLISVPFYIHLMGAESYGMVGVFVSLQTMLNILDFGLSQSMNREMARLSIDQKNIHRMADTVRTLEIIYWIIGLGVILTIILLSHLIAYQWLNPEHLSRESLLKSLWIMAFVIGLRWPIAIYMGGLNGLQQQVLTNVINIFFGTLQSIGALLALWFIAPTLHIFFIWQAIIALLQVITIRIALWKKISFTWKGKFNKNILKEIWLFAAGMSGIALTGIFITQIDKIILSKMLALSEFGYYSFAVTVAAALHKLIIPIFTTYYPRLTELVTLNDHQGLIKTYHQGCQIMMVAILPISFIIAFFSKEILQLWTQDYNIASHSATLLSLLILGNALNGVLHLPYALQIAHGWTSLTFYTHIISLFFLIPAIYYSIMLWGAVGAAIIWILFNAAQILITIPIMHRYVLSTEKFNWYLSDLLKPLCITTTLIILIKYILQDITGILLIISLLISFIIITIALIKNLSSLSSKFSIPILYVGKKND